MKYLVVSKFYDYFIEVFFVESDVKQKTTSFHAEEYDLFVEAFDDRKEALEHIIEELKTPLSYVTYLKDLSDLEGFYEICS